MIVAEKKPLEEIKEMIKGRKRVLNVGCGGCTSICLAGGQKEVGLLNEELQELFKADQDSLHVDGYTIERQCNPDFYSELDEKVKVYDAVLSMACGAGVQFLADRYPEKVVFPALNTVFVGVDRDSDGMRKTVVLENASGDTGGSARDEVQPFQRALRQTSDDEVEVSKDTPCAWFEIYDRLKKQGRLDLILKVRPPREWKNTKRGCLIQEPYKKRYAQ
jgi:hypothetical protein